ncbi:hypothetical protein MNV49_005474 [Pseudohyphozyma bogoriensis]|nr:hypothetical protein MNV49_005474 [Pseudohyphozyma bogoriensis]
MLAHVGLAASLLSLSLLPFTYADPADGIATSVTTLYTDLYCSEIDANTAAGTLPDGTCGCVSAAAANVCPTTASTCSTTANFGPAGTQIGVSTATCEDLTTCGGFQCEAYTYTTTTIWQNQCTGIETPTIVAGTNGNVCDCASPASATACGTVPNGYTACSYVTLTSTVGVNTPLNADTQCAFDCQFGYELNAAETACVLIPTAASRKRALAAARRALERRQAYVF